MPSVLPISELPAPTQSRYGEFLSHLKAKAFRPAQSAIRDVLQFYKSADREIPAEIVTHYGRLLLLEKGST